MRVLQGLRMGSQSASSWVLLHVHLLPCRRLARLELKIPWTRISSEPSVFDVEELVIVLKPRNFRQGWDAKEAKRRQAAAKQHVIDNFERARAAQAAETDGDKAGYAVSAFTSLLLCCFEARPP